MSLQHLHASLLALLLALFPRVGPQDPPSPAVDRSPAQAELETLTERIRKELEELRGESFLRPVQVRVTDREGFVRYAKQRMEKHLPEGEFAREEALAKMLGLVPAELDLLRSTFALLEEQVGGFYDPGSDTFFLMDSFTGPIASVILAHELTHALDDQLFDIDAKLEALLESQDALTAYTALVEGSGTSLMTAWMLRFGRALSPADLAQAASMGSAGLSDAPAYLWKPLLFAYLGGQRFLDHGHRLRKKAGASLAETVREAFGRPPLSTEQVLHPDKYWKRDAWDAPRPLEQVATELPPGWSVLAQRTMGELLLALVVGSDADRAGIDASNPMAAMLVRYTNRAAEGWGGDSALLLEREGARLLRLVTRWDSPEDAAEFRAAVQERRPGWELALRALDELHGLALLPPAPEAADEVVLLAWIGLTGEEAAEVAQGVETREMPSVLAAPPPPASER